MEDPDRSGHPGTPGRGAFLILYLKAAVETESDIMSPTKEQERNAMKRPRASKGGFIYAKRVRNEGPPFEQKTLPSNKNPPFEQKPSLRRIPGVKHWRGAAISIERAPISKRRRDGLGRSRSAYAE